MKPTVNQLFPSGAYEVSTIVDNQLIRRIYFGHTKEEASAAFREELRVRAECVRQFEQMNNLTGV